MATLAVGFAETEACSADAVAVATLTMADSATVASFADVDAVAALVATASEGAAPMAAAVAVATPALAFVVGASSGMNGRSSQSMGYPRYRRAGARLSQASSEKSIVEAVVSRTWMPSTQ